MTAGEPRPTPSGVERPLAQELTELLAGRLPGLVGMQVTEASTERIVAHVEVREDLLAPNGYLHAGTVVTLGDTACGLGTRLVLKAEGRTRYTTTGLTASFTATARAGVVTVVATPAHLGRRTQVWDAVVTDEGDRQVALIRCTQIVLDPEGTP